LTLLEYCYTYSGILIEKGATIMKVKVTITLEDKNWQRLRMQALKDKTSASAIIDRLVADYLKTAKKGGD
jgi:predicted DNA-binding ribbon-helix-helix protein